MDRKSLPILLAAGLLFVLAAIEWLPIQPVHADPYVLGGAGGAAGPGGATGPSGPTGPTGATGPTAATATPLAFGTPGVLAAFGATELAAYPGAACTPPALALSSSAAGAWTCATPVPANTATPRATDTPAATPTALANLSYSGKLNVTGNTAISASATPAAGDRNIYCTSGSSSDATYTMPAATGTGRVIDVWKIDSGTKSCILGRAGSDTLNGATTLTLSSQYNHETCIDQATNVWLCVGNGA